MVALILLAAALAGPQQVSLECVNMGAAQTPPVAGPRGVTAVLEVSTEDDHSKNSHECNAEYRLLTSAAGGAAKPADVITSDGDWGRSLSIHLSGFSDDGKRLFGVLNEGGKYTFTMVFDY